MIYSAGIVLFRNKQEREYLLLLYSCEEGYWGLCKGHIEDNENLQETALREAWEETGLREIKLIPGFKQETSYIFNRDGNDVKKQVSWLLGEVLEGHDGIVSEEHSALQWLPFDKAIDTLKYEKDRITVKAVEKFLS